MIKKSRHFRFLTIICITAWLIQVSCRQPAQQHTASAAGTEDTAAAADTMAGKAVITYAKGFHIGYYDHYKVVDILNPTVNKTDTLRYLLVQRGYPTPAGFPGAQVITIPVRTMIGMSSSHVALAGFAGVADRIIGLGSLQYITSPIVRKNIAAGKVTQVGLDGNMNNELIISMHPGVLIAMANPDAGFGRYKTLTDAGVPVLLNTEWLEATPLGRAEWVKLMAALVNREDLVNKKFDSLAQTYNNLAQLGRSAATQPHVIIGMPFKGTWYLPGGEGYMARFLKDAGAGYKWADTKGTGSLALDFESVASEALTADFWLNQGYVDKKEDLLAKDPRYAGFGSFKTGRLYNNNKLTNDIGSNDYWESGEVSPQIILADLIRILHPELLPDHQLVYYKQLK